MPYLYGILAVLIVAVSVFFLYRELKSNKKEDLQSRSVIKNKKQIEKNVSKIEAMLVLADGNNMLCNRLVEIKESVKFLNPSKDAKVMLIDEKISNKLDDLKIEISKDNTVETIWRIIEEVEGFVATRIKQELG